MVIQRLKDLRAVTGVPCRELDRLAGLSDKHVQKLEERDGGMSIETAQKLAPVLGCSVGYLVNGEGKRPTNTAVKRALARARANQARVVSQ
jgi:transcriptional regulator with XRE-family HTH domain